MTHFTILIATALMCLLSSSCLLDVDTENEDDFTRAIEDEPGTSNNDDNNASSCDAIGDRSSCNNAGFCEEDQGLFTCDCDEGYAGPRCGSCDEDYERMGGSGSICTPDPKFMP